LNEKIKNKFYTKLKSKTSKSKSKNKKQIDRRKKINIETRHINEYKDKIKDSPIYECIAYERLWFKSQTFHLTKKQFQQLAKYVSSLETTKLELLSLCVVLVQS